MILLRILFPALIWPSLSSSLGHIPEMTTLSLTDLAISTSAQYSSLKVSLSKSSLTQSLLPTWMIMFSRLVFSGRCKIADEISLTLPPRMHIGSVSHSKPRLLMSLIIELPIRSVHLGFCTSLCSVGVLVDKCASSHTCISVFWLLVDIDLTGSRSRLFSARLKG